MEIINLISSNIFLLGIIFFIISGVIINLVTATAKKTGEVAVKSSVGIFNIIFNLIKKIFIFIKDVFYLLFLFLIFLFAYFSKRK